MLPPTEAPDIRAQTFVQERGQLPIALPTTDEEVKEGTLHLVGQYTHLGTSFGQSLHFGGEVQRRIGQATTAFRQLAKPVFANRKISITTRLQLLEALVCSRLLYNAGVWPELTPKQHKKLEHVILVWQRRVIGKGFWSNDNVPDAVLQRRWKLPPLATRLALARIRFALAASRHASSTVWRLIGQEANACKTSWLQLLLPALQWITDIIPNGKFSDTPCGGLSFQQVTEWFASARRPTKALLKRALSKHLLQEQIIQEVRDGYQRVRDVFEDLGLYYNEEPPIPRPTGSFPCEACGLMFSNAQKLQVHRWSKHSLISQERRFVFGPTCAGCGVNYWTPQRVQQHLRSSRCNPDGCFAKLFKYMDPVDEPTHFDIPDDLKDIQRLPALQVCQPVDFVGPSKYERLQSQELEQWELE